MAAPTNVRVLLLEDNPADIRLIQESLAEVHAHCELDVVKTVHEGLAYLEALGKETDRPLPGLALLDIKVPGGSGIDLLEAIRADGRLHDLPCLMLTTSEWETDIDDAKAAGATSYYVKPRDLEGMLQFARELDTFWLERTNG